MAGGCGAVVRCWVALLVAVPLLAAVEGVVQNGSTGQPQAGATVTVIKLEQGMDALATATSDAAGKFRFPDVTLGDEAHYMLRAEYQGVTYNRVIAPGMRTGDVTVTVFRSAPPGPKASTPEQHLMLVEPSGEELTVNESYLYRNNSQPPVSYVDKKQGTLRFYLPPTAKGQVEAHVSTAAGVPIRVGPEKAGPNDIYKIDYPIRPGDTRIDVTYKVPYAAGMVFTAHSQYPGMVTRVVAPAGVTVEGQGLEAMGEEPQTKAAIFNAPKADTFRFTVSGTGRLTRPQGEGEGETEAQNGPPLTVVPVPVYERFWQILGFASAILLAGLYGLYTASGGRSTPKKRKA
jgi:hypothetical protein